MCDLNLLLYIFRVSKVALIRTYIFVVRVGLPAGVTAFGGYCSG